jgi:hypothetical protein
MGVSFEAGLGGRYHEREDQWEVNRNETVFRIFTLPRCLLQVTVCL